MLFGQHISSQPFGTWLRQDRENRQLLIIALTAIGIQFILFKFFYPFPNFMPPDSYSYLDAADQNLDINMWAIGYSKFLRLFSSLTRSDIALVWFQYLLLEGAVLYFLFSLKYILSPGKWLFHILVGLTILNPLVPHIANFVSSDALFAALSLVWFTQLMWILHKPGIRLLLWHACILLLAFTVRYNSLYYPLVSMVIIATSRLRIKAKAVGIGAIIFLLGAFVLGTEYQYHRQTGAWQFSAFGSWQLAANALYGYAYAKPDPVTTVPLRMRALHAEANQHMDSLRPIPPFLRPDNDVGVYYLWDFKSPLKVHLDRRFANDTIHSYFDKWASEGPLYAAYGRYLIEHHPGPFLLHYVWPNLVKYYAPPVGFMGSYNLGNSQVDPIAVKWFGWKSNKLFNRFKDKGISITQPFQVLLAVNNLVFITGLVAYLTLGGFRKSFALNRQIILWTVIIWIANTVFSVLSAPIELRYQLFPTMVTFAFSCFFVSFLVEAARSVPSAGENHQTPSNGSNQTRINLIKYHI